MSKSRDLLNPDLTIVSSYFKKMDGAYDYCKSHRVFFLEGSHPQIFLDHLTAVGALFYNNYY